MAYKKYKQNPAYKFFLSEKTLRNKIHLLKKLTARQQREILKDECLLPNHCGYRNENKKITDEAIKYMIEYQHLIYLHVHVTNCSFIQ